MHACATAGMSGRVPPPVPAKRVATLAKGGQQHAGSAAAAAAAPAAAPGSSAAGAAAPMALAGAGGAAPVVALTGAAGLPAAIAALDAQAGALPPPPAFLGGPKSYGSDLARGGAPGGPDAHSHVELQ